MHLPYSFCRRRPRVLYLSFHPCPLFVEEPDIGKLGDGLHKSSIQAVLFSPERPKIDDTAAATACKAVPVGLLVIHTQARVLIFVERTQPGGLPAALAKPPSSVLLDK